MARAMVSTVSPNASDTPSKPIPTFGNAAANTALPHPPRTSQNVPINSAVHRFVNDMEEPLLSVAERLRRQGREGGDPSERHLSAGNPKKSKPVEWRGAYHNWCHVSHKSHS